MNSLFHSIRWRIQAWHGLILFVAITAFCVTAYQLAKDNIDRRIYRDLRRLEGRLFRGMMTSAQESSGQERAFDPQQFLAWIEQGDFKIPDDTLTSFQGTDPGYAYFALVAPDGRILYESQNAPPITTEQGSERRSGPVDSSIKDRREIYGGPPEGVRTVVGRDINPERDDLNRLTFSLIISGFGVWTLGLVGGWWLAGRAIKPIASISQTATRIADGNLSERIDTLGTDNELDQLARVLNQTFEQLNQAFLRQRRFTADASHELRTPVTILLSETQRILKRERSTDEYREALQNCHDGAIRMRGLIEALLTLAQQEGNAAQKERCDLAKITAEQLRQIAPLSQQKNVSIQSDLQPGPCLGDNAALAILIFNLISNAIQYSHSDGTVFVSTSHNSGSTTLTVRDEGIGIDPIDLPHIFERFYRADKARTGTSGHTGLGLAIAHTIAENHGGSLTAKSAQEKGSTFTLQLPSPG